MTWPVYTRRLFYGAITTAGVTDLATVPDGQVWIVTCVDTYITATATGQALVLYETTEGASWASFEQTTLRGGPWRGEQAFTAGQVIAAYVAAGSWELRATGKTLSA